MTIPKLYNLPTVNQSALLTIAEGDFIPFDIQRVYWITSNLQDEIRGEHAHKSCQQLLSCLSGKLKISMEDIEGKKYFFELSQPNEMALIPPQYWCKIEYSKDAIVLVMASQTYDANDYIREYDTFKSQVTS